MNPHIVIDTALESVEESDGSVGVQLWAERIITKAFHEKLITLEERDHYNGRLTRIVGRQMRKAA